jgi:hypothetical protein
VRISANNHKKLLTAYYVIIFVSKHLFIPNFAGVKCGYVVLSQENKPLVESSYEARSEKELAVLVEYIDSSKIEAPEATWLDIILYSRDQIIKENQAMGTTVSFWSSLIYFV